MFPAKPQNEVYYGGVAGVLRYLPLQLAVIHNPGKNASGWIGDDVGIAKQQSVAYKSYRKGLLALWPTSRRGDGDDDDDDDGGGSFMRWALGCIFLLLLWPDGYLSRFLYCPEDICQSSQVYQQEKQSFFRRVFFLLLY